MMSTENSNTKKWYIKSWEVLFSTKVPKKIIDHYLIDLKTEFDCILLKKGEEFTGNTIIETISDEFDKAFKIEDQKTWNNVYKIEKYLAYICDEETLNTDLKRLLLIYKRHFSKEDYDHFENEKNILLKSNNLDEKRQLLLRLQSELHAFYIKRSEQRDFAILSRIRVAFTFLVGVVLFLSSLIICFFIAKYSNEKYSEIMGIVLVMTTGFFGASFSLLANLKSQLNSASLEDLKILHRQAYIISRPFIGVGAAIILYFIFQANLLNILIHERLSPNLPILDLSSAGYQNISSLIIWSFIAGFSEMLVPNLLIEIEKR